MSFQTISKYFSASLASPQLANNIARSASSNVRKGAGIIFPKSGTHLGNSYREKCWVFVQGSRDISRGGDYSSSDKVVKSEFFSHLSTKQMLDLIKGASKEQSGKGQLRSYTVFYNSQKLYVKS